MKKPALTFARHDLPRVAPGFVGVVPIPANLFLLPTELHDRVGSRPCEENPQRQQIIPYIVLVNEQNKVFCYSRGAAGAEDKLKAKLSIGLGGHVDNVPPPGTSLHSWVVEEARRELEEEVGFTDATAQVIFDGLIFDRSKDVENAKVYVGQVHVGLLSVVRCNSSAVGKLEAGIIEDAGWCSTEYLTDVNERLELWSQAALTHILKG